MIVKEQQISPTVNPGASFLFESWYVAREDVNIYNSMATQRCSELQQHWNPGGDAAGIGSTAIPNACSRRQLQARPRHRPLGRPG
jgi:hypothetical protein